MMTHPEVPMATCHARLVPRRARTARGPGGRARSAHAMLACVVVVGPMLAGLAACAKASSGPDAAPSGSSVAVVPPEVASSPSAPASPIRSDEDCRKSRVCVEFGACTFRDGRCAATSTEDCARSEWCKRVGSCAAHDGQCMVAATTNADCRGKHGEAGKDVCAAEGLCTARDGVCEAVLAEDCEKSDQCRDRGSCTPKDGRCALTSTADCRRSVACSASGLCKYEETHGIGRCVSDKPEGDGHKH